MTKKIFWDGREWDLESAVSFVRKLAEKPDKRLSETISLVEAGDILDVGCGAGISTYLIAKSFPGAKVLGIDMNESAIKIANKAFKLPNLSFGVSRTEKFHFRPSSFDCIMFLEVIEHVENPGMVLDSFNKLLRNKGILIISTPNAASYEFSLRNLRDAKKTVSKINNEPSWSGTQTDHIAAWDFSTLYRLLKRKGFNYVKHRFVGVGWPFGAFDALTGLSTARLFSNFSGKFGTDLIIKVRKND